MASVSLAAYANGGLLTVPPAMIGSNSVVNLKMVKMKKEIWKDVVGYEGLYQVSDFGRVKRLKGQYSNNQYKEDRIMSPSTSSNGYLNIRFCVDGCACSISVHRLVALHFIPNPENKPQVNHIDLNKANNDAQNLEWCTAKENTFHAYINGRRKPNKRGSDDYRSICVVMMDDNDNVINEFGSIMDAQRYTGVRNGNISKVINGRARTAGGYKWKIKDNNYDIL